MAIHPLLPSAVGLVGCEGNFPGISPWEARTEAKENHSWAGGKTGTRTGLLGLECSGGKASACTSTARGSGGQVPVPGTLSRCQPMPGAEPREMPAELSGLDQPPLSRTVSCQGEHSSFKAWQRLAWLVRLGSWLGPMGTFSLRIFCDSTCGSLNSSKDIQK